MRLTTRLQLATLPIVLLLMGGLGVWFQFERQRVLIPEMQQQTRAYARALDIAFEYGLLELDSARTAALLDRTAANSRVSGVRVYDTRGRVQYRSTSMADIPLLPAAMIDRVLAGTPELSMERTVHGASLFSVLRVLREPTVAGTGGNVTTGAVLGALEVSQPYAMLLAGVRKLGIELLLAAVLLMLTLTLIIAYTARRVIARPLELLVAAARAVGEGHIDSRVSQSLGAAELNSLAREFNVMAARVSSARQELLRESEERVRLERRLAEAERLATAGTLAAGLAHEIGAPLNVISARAEMLLRQVETTPNTARHLQSIVAQSGRITRTVRSLLDYARRPARRDELVNVDAVLNATFELLEAEFERSQVTIERIGSVETWVRGDADQLQQVITNLLLNALQAMDGQSPPHVVNISVEACSADPAAPPGDAVLTVSDTGPGLPAELEGRLFTPFATTKSSGTGLGLVVARSIVQDHGGTLEGITRTDGISGARFTIRLPRAATPLSVTSKQS